MSWDELLRNANLLQAAVKKSKAVNVNSAKLRGDAKALVQLYFRQVQPELSDLQIDEPSVNEGFQYLLTLSNGNNAKSRYIRTLGGILASLRTLEVERELALGRRTRVTDQPRPSRVEELITQTLEGTVPDAALSYRQAQLDLADRSRVSYRGTANELREAMREIIDHLAPDNKVMAESTFRLEKDRDAPTTAQKVKFVLKQRTADRGTIDTVERSALLIDELTASLARRVSQRSSKSTHTVTGKNEVTMIKRYVDNLLCELLEIPVAE